MRMSNRELSRRIEALEASRTDLHNCKMDVNITPYIADCYIPVHQAIAAGEYSFINLPGGRGSGKSSYCSLELVSGVQKDPEANALVIRKFGTTLRGSVVNQVQWAIDILGVSDDWKLTIIPLQFVHKKSGQVIRFSGLDDPMKLKSLKPTRGFFKFLWVEEFCEISGAAELRNLQQSVLRGGDRFVSAAFLKNSESVIPGISTGFWNERKMPLLALLSALSSVMSSPSKMIFPPVTLYSGLPSMVEPRVDFPAPFCPIRTCVSPSPTARSTPCRSSVSSAATVRFSIFSISDISMSPFCYMCIARFQESTSTSTPRT